MTLREAAELTIQTIDAGGYSGLEWQTVRAALREALEPGAAIDDKPTPAPVAIVFPSRSGNATPHVVTVTAAQPTVLTCTCPAWLKSEHTGGCWAMRKARALLGL